MSKYEMLSGPFIGNIVEDGYTFIAHIPFSELDDDLQTLVREFGEEKYFNGSSDTESDFPVSLNDLVGEYENSWEQVQVEE